MRLPNAPLAAVGGLEGLYLGTLATGDDMRAFKIVMLGVLLQDVSNLALTDKNLLFTHSLLAARTQDFVTTFRLALHLGVFSKRPPASPISFRIPSGLGPLQCPPWRLFNRTDSVLAFINGEHDVVSRESA